MERNESAAHATEREQETTQEDEQGWELFREAVRELGLPEEETVAEAQAAWAELQRRRPDLAEDMARQREALKLRAREVFREIADGSMG